MDAILLAAGYGTRLYPLTRDRPKPLLPLGGRPILDHLVDALEGAPAIHKMLLVTNARFCNSFRQWATQRTFAKPLRILSDGTTCNEKRLGAIGDIHYALRETGRVPRDGIYVAATDNLPRFDPAEIIKLSVQKGSSAVFACRERDPERLKRTGVTRVDSEGRITEFEEKPQHPKGHLCVPPFYVYTFEAASLIEKYLKEGNNPDAPGHFLAWLVGRHNVYTCIKTEGTYDIGTIESYRAACEAFQGEWT